MTLRSLHREMPVWTRPGSAGTRIQALLPPPVPEACITKSPARLGSSLPRVVSRSWSSATPPRPPPPPAMSSDGAGSWELASLAGKGRPCLLPKPHLPHQALSIGCSVGGPEENGVPPAPAPLWRDEPPVLVGDGVCSTGPSAKQGHLRGRGERGYSRVVSVWLWPQGVWKDARPQAVESGSPAAVFKAARAEGKTKRGSQPGLPRGALLQDTERECGWWPWVGSSPLAGHCCPDWSPGLCTELARVPAQRGHRLSSHERLQISVEGPHMWAPTVPGAVRRGN